MKHSYTKCRSIDAICLMLTFRTEPTSGMIKEVRTRLVAFDVHSLANMRRGLEAEAVRGALRPEWRASLEELRTELRMVRGAARTRRIRPPARVKGSLLETVA